VPPALALPAGQRLLLSAAASGAQIYRCEAGKSESAPLQWVLRAPEADLFDAGGRKIGRHYAGPSWELDDGSKVVGELVARDPGPDAAAVPWLLLKAKSASGEGKIGATQFVRRLETVGGKPPEPGCAKSQEGSELRVSYRAVYEFYAAPK
jgi:hypothetical protein